MTTPVSAGARILVVEDSATQAAALAMLLEAEGYQPVVARTGEIALEMARVEHFDLVLTDVLMPGIDGYEVCRRIKRELGRDRLPVVLLTSLADPLAIVRGLESGADHYVTKPYDPERLLARVRHVLARAPELPVPEGKPVTVDLLGTPFTIRATKEQILDLLVSSYGDLVRTSEVVRAAEQRARFLAEAGELFSSSLEVERILRDLARLAVPALADLCAVDMVGESGALFRVEVAYADATLAGLAAALREASDSAEHPSLVHRALASGAAELIDPVEDEHLRSAARDEKHLESLRAVPPRSVMAVPLRARGNTLGAILFVATRPERRYNADDLALADDLARRAALAVDNARLYREAQQATRTRDDVLAIVSHDLRNPINTIQMSAGFLAEVLGTEAAVQQLEKQLGVIRRAALRANSLIQDLLDVSRIEAGSLAVKQAPVEAGALLADAVAEAQPLAAERSLHLEAQWSGEPVRVAADRDRVMQALSNLIGNAIKFTTPGGRVEVRGRPVDRMVEVAVSDTGSGIPEEHLPHLFDRFWQATRSGRAGAGLGLYITKGIVEAHGGEIRVDSVPGSGATFTLTLPRTNDTAPAPAAAPPDAAAPTA